MFFYVFSIILIILSNVIYNIAQKSTPENINPFSGLLVTYLTATILTLIATQFYKTDKSFFQSISEVNWTSIMLGFAIVGLELGYLLAYRAGWNISIGSLVANIALAIILIPVGIIMYKEAFEINKIVGVIFCVIGLIIINK